MIVIGIIGILTAISVPVVMQSLAKARNAAIKAEIDMLHMAIMNYKNQYGSFPPCVDRAFGDITSGSYSPNGEATRHLQRVFPRCSSPSGELTAAALDFSRTTRTLSDTVWLTCLYGSPSAIPLGKDLHLTPNNAIVAWLSGFRADPARPLTGSGGPVKLYDFDNSRITSPTSTYPLQYHPSKKPESPYLYINSTFYNSFPHDPTLAPQVPGAERLSVGGAFFNADTFQILCAGRDGVYGTDDDLSNFWPGTRREYQDSQ